MYENVFYIMFYACNLKELQYFFQEKNFNIYFLKDICYFQYQYHNTTAINEK